MAKNPNLIQFTLAAEQREKLASLKGEESSIDLVAKRLLLNLLEESPEQSPRIDPIKDLELRIKTLEDLVLFGGKNHDQQ